MAVQGKLQMSDAVTSGNCESPSERSCFCDEYAERKLHDAVPFDMARIML